MDEKIDSILCKLDVINQSLSSIPKEDDLYIKYLLPFLMLLISIGAKVVIDREANRDDALKSLFKVPAELTFLCTSLLIAFSAYDLPNTTKNLFYIILFIGIGMLNIFLGKRATKAFEVSNAIIWRNLIIGNAIISFVVLLLTVIFI